MGVVIKSGMKFAILYEHVMEQKEMSKLEETVHCCIGTYGPILGGRGVKGAGCDGFISGAAAESTAGVIPPDLMVESFLKRTSQLLDARFVVSREQQASWMVSM